MICDYILGSLKPYLYITDFSRNILTIDDDECNIDVDDIEYSQIYLNDVQVKTESNIDNNKFTFKHTLTLSMNENNGYSNYYIIELLKSNSLFFIVEDYNDEKWIVNVEYPMDLSYSYEFASQNVLTITLTINSNIPILSFKSSINATSEFRKDFSCEYSTSKITKLQLAKKDNVVVKINEDGFDIDEKKVNALMNVDFIDGSVKFTDSYEEGEYEQNIEFSLPFSHYFQSFKYRLMEFVENRYVALLTTSNGNTFLLGYHQGLFPSYTIETTEDKTSINTITITLNAKYKLFSTIASDNVNIVHTDGFYYVPIEGECSDGWQLYITTLIRKYNSDGTPTDKYVCYAEYAERYEDYDIEKMYTSPFDNSYGIKLYDASIDCGYDYCKLLVPNDLNYHKLDITRKFTVDTNCYYSVRDYSNGTVSITRNGNEFTLKSIGYGEGYIQFTSEDSRVYRTYIRVNENLSEYENEYNIDGKRQNLSVLLSQNADMINGFTVLTSKYIDINVGNNDNEVILTFKQNDDAQFTHTVIVIYLDGTREKLNIIQDKVVSTIVIRGQEQCDNEGNKWLIADKYVDGRYVDKVMVSQTKKHCEECLTGIVKKTLIDTICYNGFQYDVYSLINVDGVEYYDAQRNEYTCEDGIPYLAFDGDDYFDTKYIPKYNSKFEVMYQSETPLTYVFGSKTNDNDAIGLLSDGNAIFVTHSNAVPSSFKTTQNISEFDFTAICRISNENASTDIINIDWQTKSSYSTDKTLYIGALNDNGNETNYFKGKLFYLKIYEDDVLVHFYVPRMNVNPSLYDKMTRKYISSDYENVDYHSDGDVLARYNINENSYSCENDVTYNNEYLNVNNYDVYDFYRISSQTASTDYCSYIIQYTPNNTQYRYRKMPYDEKCFCDGFDLYEALERQIWDADEGTWVVDDTVIGDLVESDSKVCGYSNLVNVTIQSNISGSSVTLLNGDGLEVDVASELNDGKYSQSIESDKYKFLCFNSPILPNTSFSAYTTLTYAVGNGFSQPTAPFKGIITTYSLPTTGKDINIEEINVINASETTSEVLPNAVTPQATWLVYDTTTNKLTIQPNDTRTMRSALVTCDFGDYGIANFIVTQKG